MIPPALAARWFAAALALGAGLGLFYEFLRPLRPRFTGLGDLLFLSGAFPVWIFGEISIMTPY